ncbi:hypothetical protein BAE44_0018505 [Dichanthelium oligosanthes]|uniref:Lon N-terminal domain-containing protein n=1 Tax=Dichanthelium oligosanthes TaxID=888268 RepID=A0A1E5V5N6_9POAL|nr:hypothetical protein BAE44_0018505 [Dichanthelium oligosanthes]
MAASVPLRLLSPSSSPRPPQDPSPRTVPPLNSWLPRRRQLRAVRCASSLPPPPPPPSLDLPLLPFQPAEVLIPSESKTLHLYEARYIALLEEALYKRKNSFVHFVLDPVVDSSTKSSFADTISTLFSGQKCVDGLSLVQVQKLEIGALISIRGVCRVNISNLLDMEPYFRGTVSPMMDEPYEGIELGTRISKLRESICNLHSLQMKLKVPEDEPLQTNIRASLLWSEKEIFEQYNDSFIPGFPERLSFAAYQTVSGDVSLSFQPFSCQSSELVTLTKLSLFVPIFSEKCLSYNDQPKR